MLKIARYIIRAVKGRLIKINIFKMAKLNNLDWIALILLIVGGLNWGLVAFNWNLVDSIFGMGSTLSMIIYGLVGLSALWVIFVTCKKVMMKSSM